MVERPDLRHDVAIVGMACRFPGAENVAEFWANLLAGRDTISRSTSDDRANGTFVEAVGKLPGVELFDADYFKITHGEASSMDPQQRLLLEVAVAAMEDAGYGRGEAAQGDGPVVGVFVGGGESEYLHEFVAPASGRDPYNDLRLRTGNGKDFLAARLAFKLGLSGPSVTVQAGCATGLVAVATACNALAAGDCDIAIAGCVSLVMPDVEGYEYEVGGILSADGYCRPFDARASGTVPSSGVGVVVLKRDVDATRDLDSRRAVLKGWAVNNDGGSRSGFTVPNITGQSRVIRRALDRAGIAPDEVGFVETHGTATAVGDAVEIEALKHAFGDADYRHPCLLGSIKANIGHADAAAGLAGLIKCVFVVEHGLVPPLVHFTELHDSLDLAGSPFAVPTQIEPWPKPGPRVAGVSSFGLGGNNAHVVVGAARAEPGQEPHRAPHVVALSAGSPKQLEQLRARTGRWFLDRMPMSGAAFADAAFTLAVGRRSLKCRWAVAVRNAEEAARALTGPSGAARSSTRFEVTVAGSEAELSTLGQGELATQPAYQATVTRLVRELREDAVPPSDAGRAAFAIVAVLQCLEELGLTFARADGPSWIQPALDWHAAGDRAEPLAAVLRACGAGASRAGRGTEKVGAPLEVVPGRVVLDSNFSLSATVANAWQAGAPVQLEGLYHDQARRRCSMPTYPFARREHWIPRTATSAAAGPASEHKGDEGDRDVSALVAKVWREVLGFDEIDPDANFVDDLGGDSMYAVEIGGRLADELGLALPIDLPFEAPTIRKAVAAVTAARTATPTQERTDT
jgi:acyl transferase domain-containing protein